MENKENNKKEKRPVKNITRRQLIKEVAEKLDIYEDSIEEVYSALETSIVDHLLECSDKEDIYISFTTGIKFLANFVPKHWCKHPVTHEEILVNDKIKFKGRFSKHWTEDRIKDWAESRMLYVEWKERIEQQKENKEITNE